MYTDVLIVYRVKNAYWMKMYFLYTEYKCTYCIQMYLFIYTKWHHIALLNFIITGLDYDLVPV